MHRRSEGDAKEKKLLHSTTCSSENCHTDDSPRRHAQAVWNFSVVECGVVLSLCLYLSFLTRRETDVRFQNMNDDNDDQQVGDVPIQFFPGYCQCVNGELYG